MSSKITSIKASEILSASDFPTIETEVFLENGVSAKASVPFGTSSGKYEAVTLVDNDPSRYGGGGMLKAIKNVEEIIAPEIIGLEVSNQKEIDAKLLSLDPTPRKEILGGNSLLSVSLAAARCASMTKNVPLYEHIRQVYGISEKITTLPKPMMVVMEGGRHADGATDFQEYLIAVGGNAKISENIRVGSEVYHSLGEILDKLGFEINVGLEGAYAATNVKSNKEPLDYIQEAIKASGYEATNKIKISLDPAASEFYKDGVYHLTKEGKKLSSSELIEFYKKLTAEYNLFSIEDPLEQDDWDSWGVINSDLGNNVLIVGDDLTVTQPKRVQMAIDKKSINALIVKPNQVGTLTETMEVIELCKRNNLKIIVSHRGGGETTDTFIIDLAVAVGADFVKVGPSRGERVEKYNRLMEIGKDLNL